ncbi:MAG: hypothetical protein ACJART_002568 [Maribacter sp.]
MIYIPTIAAGIPDPEFLRSEELLVMVVVGVFILMPVFLLGIMTFGLALNAAFLKICKQNDIYKAKNNDYFNFFKEARLGKVFNLALIMLGLTIVRMLTCGIEIFI